MHRFIVLLCALFLLSGCSFIPSLENYKPKVPNRYPHQDNSEETLTAQNKKILGQIEWTSFYQDQTLQQLIKMALEHNQDLRTSTLRICEARSLYGIERSTLFPELKGSGSFTRQRTNSSRSTFQQNGGGSASIFNVYGLDVGVTSYEIDLFGRLRSLNKAALSRYLSTVYAARSVYITLIADIATAYISLRKNQALLRLAKGTQRIRKQAFDLIQKQAKEGVITDLDVAEAETILLQAGVDIYKFTDAVASDMNTLRFLVGQHQTLPNLKNTRASDYFKSINLNMPVGLPSSLLYNRPDIQEAEANLKSANADIGAARSAFFPTISLTGSSGYTSRDLSNLFKKSSQVWSYMPEISIPIFTFGRLQNNLNLSCIRKEISIVNYERAIEVAFLEVSNALSSASTLKNRVDIQRKLVNATKRREKLSVARYEAGIEDFLAALDSKRELYTAEQDLITQKADEANAKILLYKAVGGGFDTCQEKPKEGCI